MGEDERRGDWVAAAAVGTWSAAVIVSARGDLWLGLGATAIALGLLVGIAQWRRLRPLIRCRPLAGTVGALVGAVVGMTMAVATHLLFGGLARILPDFAAQTTRLYARVGSNTSLAHALWVVPIAAGEELVWRGAVQEALRRRLRPALSVLLAATIYALVHAPLGAPLVIAAFGCGLAWSTLRAATGSLVAPFMAHLVWDQVVLFMDPLVPPLVPPLR
jgi:membrane protease YdiL (CAAX protease family)